MPPNTINKVLFFCFSIVLASSCSFNPVTSTKTARPLGKGKWEINTGFSPAPTFSAGKGISENWDLGGTLEMQYGPVVAAWAKYAVKHGEEGLSGAIYGGASYGAAIGTSKGLMLGPVMSYKRKWFEVVFLTRYNYVHWEVDLFTEKQKDDSILDLSKLVEGNSNIKYMQSTLGLNFWFSEKFGLNISAQHFYSLTKDGPIFGGNIVPGIELMWR